MSKEKDYRCGERMIYMVAIRISSVGGTGVHEKKEIMCSADIWT